MPLTRAKGTEIGSSLVLKGLQVAQGHLVMWGRSHSFTPVILRGLHYETRK